MEEPVLHGLGRSAAERTDRLLRPGNTNCRGCGMSVALNMLDLAVGGDRPLSFLDRLELAVAKYLDSHREGTK